MKTDMPWTMNDVARQDGKIILVTGSNTGIGFATAKLLASKGATIVMACRNLDKAQQAQAQIKAEVPRADLRAIRLDLASLASVRECAAELNNTLDRMDVLINNAGLMMPPLQRTADGFEMQFGTNVLGHFGLTGLVLPLLLRTSGARVVWVSSVAHWRGQIDFDNLNAERGYNRWRAYAQSKLADLMLAYEMNRRLVRAGASLISLAAHPGGTQSELSRYSAILKFINVLTKPLLQTTDAGAMPSVRAAVDPEAKGGEFYGPGGLTTMTGPPTKQRSSKRSHDEAVARELWRSCEQLTGVRWLNE
jgi:NAD(P)-dependent dehydrogenase (short-subunit alcohol dehydrogenase family)